MAWLGLGKSCLLLRQYDDAVEALKIANILDPLNTDVWAHFLQISIQDTGRSQQIISCLREFCKMNIYESSRPSVIQELIQDCEGSEKFTEHFKIILKKLHQSLVQNTYQNPAEDTLVTWSAKKLMEYGFRQEAKEIVSILTEDANIDSELMALLNQ